jgi:hypothetical protein
MKNYYELKFYPKPFNDSFVLPDRSKSIVGQDDDADWYGIVYKGEEMHSILDTKILDWCHRKLTAESVWVFINNNTNKESHEFIHIDGTDPKKTHFGINWCLQDINSEMAWYNIKPQYSFEEAVIDSVLPNATRVFDKNKVELVEKCRISGPTLINIGAPHSLIRHEPGLRVAVSLRFAHSFSSWNEVVQFFSPFIKK